MNARQYDEPDPVPRQVLRPRTHAPSDQRHGAINLAIFFVEHPNAYQRWLQREKATRLLRKSAGWTVDVGFVEIVEAAVESMKSGARNGCDALQNKT